jgi:uncharacterized membrane protein YgcG
MSRHLGGRPNRAEAGAARRGGRDERGFAMLLVFVMAAAVAIMLYLELPRVAFEAQRAREEMLIERGEQYQRAIQLYVRKMKKYPQRLEDLENTNQIRFLRRRYPDPMTGEEEWRLIQIEGGVYKNSFTKKPPSDEKKSVNTFTWENTGIGQTPQPTGEGASAAPRVRESERRNFGRPPLAGQPQEPPAEGQPQAPAGYAPVGYPAAPGQPQNQPGQPGVAAAPIPAQWRPLMPQQPQGGVIQVQPEAYASSQAIAEAQKTVGPGAIFQIPGSPAAQQQQPQQPQNTFTGGGHFVGSGPASPTAGSPYPAQNPAGQAGFGGRIPQPGMTPAGQGGQAGQNPGLALIQQILTSPRQGGAPPGVGAVNPGFGNGIVGVATKLEKRGIKIYNEREFYHEWEFIYDPTQEALQAGGGTGLPTAGNQQGQPQNGLGNTMGSPSGSSSNTFTGGGSFVGGGGFTGGGAAGAPSPQPNRPPGAQPNQPGFGQPIPPPFAQPGMGGPATGRGR